MIPTKQTILHDPENGQHGNCFSAVLASLLHLPIEDVPLFVDPDTWLDDTNEWLRQFGLAYLVIDGRIKGALGASGIEVLWHEVSGETGRDVLHSCVAKDGEVVFDPHPDDTGLSKIQWYGLLVALEPWKVAERHK